MKNNGFLKNIFLSLAKAMVLSYGVMSFVWIFTGMRYDVLDCFKLQWGLFFPIYFIYVGFALYYDQRRYQKKMTLLKHMERFGYDDDYYKLLWEYLEDIPDNEKKMTYASCCVDGGRYAESAEIMKTVDFSSMTAEEREEYFNILLYGALRDNKLELANDIYRKAKHYFDRAVMKGRGGNILHTLGVLCLNNGCTENAERLFFAAMKGSGAALRFECEIGLGWCALAEGRNSDAKEQCFIAAELAGSLLQAQQLKELMAAVEDSYRKTA